MVSGSTLIEIATVYAVTLIIVKSNALYGLRWWVKNRTPWLFKGYPPTHLLDCRMCTGFWVALIVTLIYSDINSFFLVYGASYFLATQER